ncbi:MAG: alanyl-tRNA synthetase [Candidatus Magasanikbacteria bacterium GW2011_GWC2_37_14]|uniref:alanine--tRNA ligase n=1 Tax=Candidatus Magasanikbacteria bacterium GW2011_GWC2_37_14 TaxID=1619046 RepID=A0A0G0IVK7_9BACT|nr:MAG: alanyl-tRNA synthetase [Candidatus Magasanikbacteria bacterium GW2011_GWC2_37_14]
MITSHELRTKYLEFFSAKGGSFFGGKGHTIIPSASLIPENDPTTLFTGSGMQPMVPYLLGERHPLGTRICDSQKSFRSQDIDDVGDNRHTTFFEMLGNWSLGDYFKKEQIEWMFEFLIKEIGLDPNKLYVTCFSGADSFAISRDEKAAELWKAKFKTVGLEAKIVENSERDGMQDGRIFYYDAKKNWWSRAGVPENMPLGEPGGPDSEMFWDFGSELKLHENSKWSSEPCHVNCDCGRFMEIGNNVFMQYKKTRMGFEELKQKNIDFGGGLERMAAALNNNPDMFKIDLFASVIKLLEKLSGHSYNENEKIIYAFRVILDHLRAATFLISDQAVPSNRDQGYFTRRLIRRSVRYARDLGINNNFCVEVAKIYIDEYSQAYPELLQKKDFILNELEKEETKFRETLEKGIKMFSQYILLGSEAGKTISGKEAFDLFQSYGFPLEMTIELATENKLTVDINSFNEEMTKHQQLSRAGAEQKFKGGLADTSEQSTKYHTATHLLLASLRQVLGADIVQKGSNITAERLRFDFNWPDKLTAEQIKVVEDLVNQKIAENITVQMQELPKDQAKDLVTVRSFDLSKYGEVVKVYKIADFSIEFCGGPHVQNTGVMGHFKITKEEACSAGVRRIKAILIHS